VQTNATDGKRVVRWVPFGGLKPDVNNSKWGNPKLEKFRLRKFVSSILSDIKRFGEFNSETRPTTDIASQYTTADKLWAASLNEGYIFVVIFI